MGQYRENNIPGISDSSMVGAGPYVRTKITGGSLNSDLSMTVGLAGASDLSIGTIDSQQANATGDQVNIIQRGSNRTRIMVAAAAISFGAYVFAAASGQVAASGTVLEGIALQPATAQGDCIEVLPLTGPLSVPGLNKAGVVLVGTADAVSPHVSSTQLIVGAAAIDAVTLAAPTATTDDWVEIAFISGSAYAHTVTFTGSTLNDGSTTQLTATFTAHPGAGFVVVAYQGKWYLKGGANAITFT